ncbi:MAG TPA: hypothetical protein VLG71_03435 [Candidatus Limnocylindria bacterium]|nr:hypothetical protein [Candidatus Limnocylindria bacterium]
MTNYSLCLGIILVTLSNLASAMSFDNRFIPLIQHPYITVPDRPSHGRVDVFMATANRAFGRLDDEIGIYEVFGSYDERDIEQAVRTIGLTVPLPSGLQLLELPWTVEGKIQAQGLNFCFQQAVHEWLWIGFSWFFMRVDARQEFFFLRSDTTALTLSEQQEIAAARRQMQEMLGLQGPFSAQSGMGDFDGYVRFGSIWDYPYKFRHVEAGLRLGFFAPVGVRRNINNPASIPFGGDGHWGIYALVDSEFEVKEDWKFGLWLMGSKRFDRTTNQRMAVGKEPYIYGPIVGKANVNPGGTFVFLPYFQFENLRDGFGVRVQYTMTIHGHDKWTDARVNKTIPVNLARVRETSSWASDYFTLNVFYDFGKVKVVREFEPILTFNWDIPAAMIVGNNATKTNKVSLGFEFNW